jgi:hypothetical protein
MIMWKATRNMLGTFTIHTGDEPAMHNQIGQINEGDHAQLAASAPELLVALQDATTNLNRAEGRLMTIDAQRLDAVARNDDVIEMIRASAICARAVIAKATKAQR